MYNVHVYMYIMYILYIWARRLDLYVEPYLGTSMVPHKDLKPPVLSTLAMIKQQALA